MPRLSKAQREIREAEKARAAELLAEQQASSSSSVGQDAMGINPNSDFGGAGYIPAVIVSDVSTSDEDEDGPASRWRSSINDDDGDQDGTPAMGDDGKMIRAASYGDGSDNSEEEEEDELAQPPPPPVPGPRNSSTPGKNPGAAPSAVSSKGPGGRKDLAICRWDDCGQTFVDLQRFIDHLHGDHVGFTRAKYSCEWSGCSRKGKPQTSRFALLSHLRSHTGEKPFTCPRPECDKSFTRSDALSKHMRVQHDIFVGQGRGNRTSAISIANAAATQAGPSPLPTRTSGRRSAAAATAAAANPSGDTLDDELLNLAAGGPRAASPELEVPGQPINFDYQVYFPPPPANNDPQLQQQPPEASWTDAQLGIERLSSINARLGVPPDNEYLGEDEVDPFQRTLESARRAWCEDMTRRQKGAWSDSQGAFAPPTKRQEEPSNGLRSVSNGHLPVKADYDSDSDEGGKPPQSNGNGTAPSASSPPPRKARDAHSLFTNSPVPSAQQLSKTPSAAPMDYENAAPPTPGHAAKMSSQNSTSKQASTLLSACQLEMLKIRYLQDFNASLVAEYEEAVLTARQVELQKTKLLEMNLRRELGQDVEAIFVPLVGEGERVSPERFHSTDSSIEQHKQQQQQQQPEAQGGLNPKLEDEVMT